MSCPHGNHPDGCERCAEIADHERAYELLFTENAKLRAEVERLAAQSAPTGLTDMGWVIDAATKGELAAYDQGCAECQQAVTKILDGKDTGAGTANPPWELLRRRLIALVAQSAPTEPIRPNPELLGLAGGRAGLNEDFGAAQK